MFKISFNVEDSHLATVLKTTASLVSDLSIHLADNPPVRPMNTQERLKAVPRPKPKPKHKSPVYSGVKDFCQIFGFAKGHQFRANDLKPHLKAAGMSPASTWYATQNEVAGGRVRKIAPGLYEVV